MNQGISKEWKIKILTESNKSLKAKLWLAREKLASLRKKVAIYEVEENRRLRIKRY